MRFLHVLLLLTPLCTMAQLRQRTEMGGGIGVFNYTGDIVRTYNLKFSRPAATFFYRYNFSQVVSLRTSLTVGSIGAKDNPNPLDPAAALRNASFKSSLVEFSPVFEYHFLDWRSGKQRIRYTPYLFAGAGLFFFSKPDPFPAPTNGSFIASPSFSRVQLSIPFGGGFKYVLNPNWYIAMEFGMRETFTDYLDGISKITGLKQNYRFGNTGDLDNYFFLGLTLTRTFYEIPCATSPY